MKRLSIDALIAYARCFMQPWEALYRRNGKIEIEIDENSVKFWLFGLNFGTRKREKSIFNKRFELIKKELIEAGLLEIKNYKWRVKTRSDFLFDEDNKAELVETE